MQESRGEVLRPEIRDVPIELVDALGRLANGSSLFVVGLDTPLFPSADTLDLETNLNDVVATVAYLINPSPENPVAISSTNEDQVTKIKGVVSRLNHETLELSDEVDDRNGSKIGMERLIENGGLFIRAPQEQGQDAIVRFVLSSDSSEQQSYNSSEIEDMFPIHNIRTYLETDLGLSAKTSRRILNQIQKLDTKHETYPNLALSKSKILEAFKTGEFNKIAGFNEKDFSIILDVIKLIINPQ